MEQKTEGSKPSKNLSLFLILLILSLTALTSLLAYQNQALKSQLQDKLVEYRLIGGFAGFCDHLVVFSNGQSEYTNECSSQKATLQIESSHLQQLQSLKSQIGFYKYENEDNPNGSDSLGEQLIFYGQKPNTKPNENQILLLRQILTKINTQAHLQSRGIQPTSIACTQEAKICPDGSSVGRSGPNCEFAPCPSSEVTNWQSYLNEGLNFQISYPGGWEIDKEPPPTNSLVSLRSNISSGVPYGPIDPPAEFDYSINIYYIPNPNNSSLEDLLSALNSGIQVVLKEETIKNLQFYVSDNEPSMSGELNYHLKLDDNSFLKISLSPYTSDGSYKNHQKIENTFKQILSTFKFI